MKMWELLTLFLLIHDPCHLRACEHKQQDVPRHLFLLCLGTVLDSISPTQFFIIMSTSTPIFSDVSLFSYPSILSSL
jgi:hypothetical protein